jgi:hypothetical protein
VVSEQASELEKLCVRYHVERLDLVGSAASGSHGKGAGDPDFPVAFQPLLAGAYTDAYFGLVVDSTIRVATDP